MVHSLEGQEQVQVMQNAPFNDFSLILIFRETCKTFGDKMCDGKALKYDHDDFCKRKAKECKCCCTPVCKSGGASSGGKHEIT